MGRLRQFKTPMTSSGIDLQPSGLRLSASTMLVHASIKLTQGILCKYEILKNVQLKLGTTNNTIK
jgi:hypothetical protein